MRTMEADVLVIGGGSAAVRAAIEAARAGVDVLLVDKGHPGESGSSPHALVGFSVPLLDEGDSEELFLDDWIRSSGGICNRNLVIQCARQGRERAEDLERIGLKFISNPDGSWFISKRSGHTVRRTIQLRGLPGGVHTNSIEPQRTEAINCGVRIEEGVMITRLLKREGRAVGAYGIAADGEPVLFNAKAVVLAAGGANRLYANLCDEVKEHHSRTMGDSYALGFHVGAPLIDMEFVQFRDSPPAGPIFGAQYVNAIGERVMQKYDPVNLEHAPRYMMARAIYWENFEGRGPVVWNVEENQVARSRAPVGHQYLAGQTIPITLMFQRLMGGASIDAAAATAIPGLFAAGESSGGVHGGDRMQGCGFLETQVFGGIAGRSAAALAKASERLPIPEEAVASEQARLAGLQGEHDPAEVVDSVRTIMWEQAGVVSNRAKLADAIEKLQALRTRCAQALDATDLVAAEEAANLCLTAELVARAKLMREETRSGHGRTDFPDTDPAWVKHVRLRQGERGEVLTDTAPVITDFDRQTAPAELASA